MLFRLMLVFVLAMQIYPGLCWVCAFFADVEGKLGTGQQVTVSGADDECVELPINFEPKSINTMNFCVKTFGTVDCTGDSLSFYPGSIYHENLTHFKLKIASVTACRTAF